MFGDPPDASSTGSSLCKLQDLRSHLLPLDTVKVALKQEIVLRLESLPTEGHLHMSLQQ